MTNSAGNPFPLSSILLFGKFCISVSKEIPLEIKCILVLPRQSCCILSTLFCYWCYKFERILVGFLKCKEHVDVLYVHSYVLPPRATDEFL
jgi:hypothetical protein